MVQFYLPVHFLFVSSITAGLANAFVIPSTAGAFVGPTTTAPSKQYSNMKFPTVGGTALSLIVVGELDDTPDNAVPPTLSDETLAALVKDAVIDAGITDHDEEKTLAILKETLDANQKDMVFVGSCTTLGDHPVSATSISAQSHSPAPKSSCEWAMIDFFIEAVSLAVCVAGMPSGAGKKVAKILVKKAQKKLLKEMKGIIKEDFGSPNPKNIASGLYKIMDIIIGEISFNDLAAAIYDSVSWWDGLKIVTLLALYFLSGGSGLIAKLAFMTPAIIDVVESAAEVDKACG